MKTRFLLFSLIAAVSVSSLSAQTDDGADPKKPEETRKDRFWAVSLPGGEYQVALSRITSVSRAKYVLDGSLIVDEVTVDTVGQSLVRFYFIKPVTTEASSSAAGQVLGKSVERAQDFADKATEITGSNVQDMVVKTYPVTTHARTIEYRILTEAQLGSIFDSARSSWENGRGTKLTVK